MRLISFDMELLISRDIGKTVKYAPQNRFDILDISLIYHFDQWIIFTVKVKANIPISASR